MKPNPVKLIQNTTEYNQMQVYFVYTDIYTTNYVWHFTDSKTSIFTHFNISEIGMHFKINGISV